MRRMFGLVDFENNEDLKKKININTAAIAYVEATFLENKIDFNEIVSIAVSYTHLTQPTNA